MYIVSLLLLLVVLLWLFVKVVDRFIDRFKR